MRREKMQSKTREKDAIAVEQQIINFLRHLSPSERLFVRDKFAVGEVAGLSGQNRIQLLSPQHREQLECDLYRKLRNQAVEGLRLRDTSRSFPPRYPDERNDLPWGPNGKGPADIWPPCEDWDAEDSAPEFWDEA